jgi:2-polyprenyl-6-methoxyphenol hydroxylase-like FAD-dependent oxidoreductase
VLGEVLIVGGGPAGMVAAIALGRAGASCEIVEIDADWSPAGVGIGLQSPPLRALKTLDLFDELVAVGWPCDEIEMIAASGEPIALLPQMNVNGPDDPPFIAMSRTALHEVLARRLNEIGTTVRLGVTFEQMVQARDGVHVEFTDGSAATYDLVIGADGLHSEVRSRILPHAPLPQYSGQVIWRIAARRPRSLERYTMMVGARTRLGLVPLSRDTSYLWMLESTATPQRPPGDELLGAFQERLACYGGVVGEIAEQITTPEQIDFRALQWLLAEPPWHADRVLIIGDAAHTTTPHLAFGVGLAIEDAVILGELVAEGLSADALGVRLAQRRYERCRLVVMNSVQLGAWEQTPATPGADPPRLMGESFTALAGPI